MSTRLTLIGVALIILCSAVFYHYDQFNGDPATSISIYDKPSSVFVVPADQWYDFDLRIFPPRGWTMVPPEVSTRTRPFVGPPTDFLGSQACAECHTERYVLQQFPAQGTAWTQTGRRGNLGQPTENKDESQFLLSDPLPWEDAIAFGTEFAPGG